MLRSKHFAALLAAALALSLVSCAPKTPAASTGASVSGAISSASQSDEQTSHDEEALDAILSDISGQVYPGTAGCTLNAVPHAGALLDWCLTTTLTADQASEAVLAWQSEQTEEVQAALPEQMQLIAETCRGLMGDTGADLMSDAGYENENAPWTAVPADILDAVLAAIPAEG